MTTNPRINFYCVKIAIQPVAQTSILPISALWKRNPIGIKKLPHCSPPILHHTIGRKLSKYSDNSVLEEKLHVATHTNIFKMSGTNLAYVHALQIIFRRCGGTLIPVHCTARGKLATKFK